jgi:20S proteasome subunit beta 7
MAVNAGTSVFALKYKDGIMIGADTGITYGSMLKIKDAKRMAKLGDNGLIACSGEMADF